MSGDAIAQEFFHRHFPLHLGVMAQLIDAGQKTGVLQKIPLLQALSFLAGAVAFPNIMATLATEQQLAPASLLTRLDQDVLSDAAIAQRVDMAIRGLRAEK
jgi:hypothetical protein